jgi:hypothetical protein
MFVRRCRGKLLRYRIIAVYIALLYTFLTRSHKCSAPWLLAMGSLRCGMDMEAEMSRESHCGRSQSQTIISFSLLIHVRARAKGEVGSRYRVSRLSLATAVSARTPQVIAHWLALTPPLLDRSDLSRTFADPISRTARRYRTWAMPSIALLQHCSNVPGDGFLQTVP